MPDKKLTDSDIKEVLDMVKAKTDRYCQECSYNDIKVCDICIFSKMKIVLDLINRLQEEKEALINGQETLQKYIADLQAENENYSKNNQQMTSDILALYKALKTAKTSAYKEFAERLKENSIATFSFKGVVMVEEIDNLLKELVGEDK